MHELTCYIYHTNQNRSSCYRPSSCNYLYSRLFHDYKGLVFLPFLFQYSHTNSITLVSILCLFLILRKCLSGGNIDKQHVEILKRHTVKKKKEKRYSMFAITTSNFGKHQKICYNLQRHATFLSALLKKWVFFFLSSFLKILLKESPIYINFSFFKGIANYNKFKSFPEFCPLQIVIAQNLL